MSAEPRRFLDGGDLPEDLRAILRSADEDEPRPEQMDRVAHQLAPVIGLGALGGVATGAPSGAGTGSTTASVGSSTAATTSSTAPAAAATLGKAGAALSTKAALVKVVLATSLVAAGGGALIGTAMWSFRGVNGRAPHSDVGSSTRTSDTTTRPQAPKAEHSALTESGQKPRVDTRAVEPAPQALEGRAARRWRQARLAGLRDRLRVD